MSFQLAQTNLQLYRQLRDAGYSKDEIATVQRDNETACLLFGSNIRSSGRPFLAHATGTGSAAVAEGARLDIIRAAFLHAAYKHGRFFDGTRGKTEAHRQWLRNRTGEAVEDLVFRYGPYPFGIGAVRKIVTSGSLDGQDRDMLLLKLCNDVDDSTEYGALLGQKARYRDPHYLADLETVSRMAGFDFCAGQFARTQAEMQDDGWVDSETVFDRKPFQRHPLTEAWRRLNGKR